jgi:hypothetical protein
MRTAREVASAAAVLGGPKSAFITGSNPAHGRWRQRGTSVRFGQVIKGLDHWSWQLSSYRMKRPFASRRYQEKPAQSGLLLTGSAFNRPQDGIAS